MSKLDKLIHDIVETSQNNSVLLERVMANRAELRLLLVVVDGESLIDAARRVLAERDNIVAANQLHMSALCVAVQDTTKLRTKLATAEHERDIARRTLCRRIAMGRGAGVGVTPKSIATGYSWGYLYPEETDA